MVLHASSAALYISRAWKNGAYSPPKTQNGYRWVEVPSALMDELRRWQTELRNIGVSVEGHDPTFPTSAGKPQTHANILQRGWYPALKRAGIYDWKTKVGKAVRFHDLRRTAVSLMRDLGVTEGDYLSDDRPLDRGDAGGLLASAPEGTSRGADAIAAALRK